MLKLFLLAAFLNSIMISSQAKACETPAEIKTAMKEMHLERVTVKITDCEINKLEKFSGKINFSEAYKLSIISFLTDDIDIESPLSVVKNILAQESQSAEAKHLLPSLLNNKNVVISLDKNPERGESYKENWIFRLEAPEVTGDILHWAIVDRSGESKVYNYGFN